MNTAYNLIVQASRYWFALLALAILIRLGILTLRELGLFKRTQDVAIGHLIWYRVDPKTGQQRIQWLPLPREALIGSARRCDVRVQDESVQKEHAHVFMQDGQLLIKAMGDSELRVGARLAVHGEALPLEDGQTVLLARVPLVFQRGGAQ